MYYFVYQTKNIVNGKTYIGVHRTKNVNDGYIGSGIYRQSCAERILRKGSNSHFVRAVKLHGYDNFEREILCFFDNYEDALEEEKWIVNKEWTSRGDNYNLSTGGLGRTDVKISEKHIETLISIHSKDYVVCNIDTGDTYFVKNLTEWCRNNFPELIKINKNKRDYHIFGGVLSGGSIIAAKKWWACRIEDWTGKPVLRKPKEKTGLSKVVCLIGDDGSVIRTFKSAKEAGKELNIDNSQICKVCRGELASTKNMVFKYAT